MPAFMAELRERGKESIAARALEFLTLTAARSGEVFGATWDEVEGNVWTIPADRMKADKEHRVPLSPRVIKILEGLPRLVGTELVFPNVQRGDRAGSMLTVLRELRPDATVHGLRSTFKDWASEKTSFQREVVEMALAHAIPDAVEKAYRRGDLFDKRRKLMDAWAAYCAGATPRDNVVNLREHA
jgi:integrase